MKQALLVVNSKFYIQGNPCGIFLLTRKAILVEQRGILKNKIDELTATLERLDYKIGIFEQRIVAHEKH